MPKYQGLLSVGSYSARWHPRKYGSRRPGRVDISVTCRRLRSTRRKTASIGD